MSSSKSEQVLNFFDGRFVRAKSGKEFEGIGLPWVNYEEDEKIGLNKKIACKTQERKLNFK